MFDAQHSRQPETDRAQTTPEQKPISTRRRAIPRARDLTGRIYPSALSNQVPLGLRLSTPQQASTQQPLQRQVNEELQGEPPDVAAHLDSSAQQDHNLNEANAQSGTAPMMIQPRLIVGPAHDQYEQEADQIADQVLQTSVLSTNEQANQREKRPEEEKTLWKKPVIQRATANAGFEASPDVESRIAASKGGGSPLPDSVRTFMEPRFGADFSGVRLHTGSEAAQLNRAVNAQAFTQGQDIYLGKGKTNLESSDGRQLLAHELTHTLQQGAPSIQRDNITSTKISETTDTGNKYTQELVLNKTTARIQVQLGVKWVKKGTWASDDAYHKFIRSVKSAAYSYMDNKFKVVCTPKAKGAGPGPIELPIDFLIYDSDGGYTIEAYGGTPGGRSAMAQAGGKVYEFVSPTVREGAITYAHEFGHAMLGASDEYANPAVPGRVLTNDHSIMANYYTQGKAKAQFKARHFQHIVTEVARAFAGYSCRIRSIK